MKKQNFVYLVLTLSMVNLLFLFWVVVRPQITHPLLYPKIEIDVRIFLLVFIAILTEFLILLCICFFASGKTVKIIVSTLLIIFILPGMILTYFVGATVIPYDIWYSSTDQYSINHLDSLVLAYLHFETCDSKELLMFYRGQEVEEYSYNYYPGRGAVVFDLEYSVKLSDERFDEAFSILKNEIAFEQNGNENKGVFTLKEMYREYDIWEEVLIEYDNDLNSISYTFAICLI